MPGRLYGWHTIIRGKQTREVHTVVRLLLGILGSSHVCGRVCRPNPFVRARPPERVGLGGSTPRGQCVFLWQRFLMQYPTQSDFAGLADIRLEALDWAVV